jgi:hypothetical protein
VLGDLPPCSTVLHSSSDSHAVSFVPQRFCSVLSPLSFAVRHRCFASPRVCSDSPPLWSVVPPPCSVVRHRYSDPQQVCFDSPWARSTSPRGHFITHNAEVIAEEGGIFV